MTDMTTTAFSNSTVVQPYGTAAAAGSFTLAIVESVNPAAVGKEFNISTSSAILGRAEECDVVVLDSSVSRRHAKIEKTAGGFMLVDVGSANGTWIGDRRVKEHLLDQGDRFRVGGTVIEFSARAVASDEMSAWELDKTSAIPLSTILPSLAAQERVSAPARLEDEGQLIEASGNTPIILDDPMSMYLLESGKVEIFTVALKDGEPHGARSHFLTVEPDQCFFGMDLARYGMGSAFLAVGKTGTKLRKIPIGRVAQLANEFGLSARIASLLDIWVTGMSHSLTKDIQPGPFTEISLGDRDPAVLDKARKARAAKGVLWLEIASGDLLFIGMGEIAFDAETVLFPVTPDTWIESTSENLSVRVLPRTTESVTNQKSLWLGLDSFHQVLCECEFLNKKLATVDEFNRLKSKARLSEAAREAAYSDIGAVLQSPGGRARDFVATGDVEPIFQACRLVGEAMGIEVKNPPQQRDNATYEDQVATVANFSRFRTRQVALRGDWWKHDQGPILGQIEETKAPIALVPKGPRSYEWMDPKTGLRTPITEKLASTLAPFGYAFYRGFADGELKALDLMKFGARGLKPEFVTLALMGVAMGVLGSLTPLFTGRIFDTAIPQAERSMLYQFAIALFIAAITTACFKITQSIAVLRVQGKMDYSVQAALWDRLLDLPSTFFKQFSSGDLADRASGISQIRNLVAGAGIGAILGSLSSVFFVVVMLMYSLPLALLGVVLTIVFVTFTTTMNYLQLRHQRVQLEMRGKISGLVLQLLSGVAKLRVSGAEHHAFRVWAREFSEQRRISFKIGRVQNFVHVFNAGFPILSNMAIFGVLVMVQKKAAEAGAPSNLSTGDFIGFTAAYGAFIAAMQALADASLSLLKVVPIYERLKPILETEPEVDNSKLYPGQLKGEIEISHVWFRYSDDSPYVLKDVSLKIKPGEFVAFVGGSGCGKSTLMRCMLGFEKPEKGSIYMDGQDLANLDLRLVRQQLGVVLQDSRVLPADIFRNIVGTSSRTIEEAWDAAGSAGLADDIKNMPMGMHTYVSEGGGGFSGGQKQRLLIARALVNKPKIIFLDEATSALDNRTQAVVTESLDRLRATRIAIAHRLSTVINADRICYMKDGNILESGSYKELMEKNGLFAELARRQIA
jgi:NHLM bacteriocin system ABC transporter ATP-binding protein